jgi:hypothetical protein
MIYFLSPITEELILQWAQPLLLAAVLVDLVLTMETWAHQLASTLDLELLFNQ